MRFKEPRECPSPERSPSMESRPGLDVQGPYSPPFLRKRTQETLESTSHVRHKARGVSACVSYKTMPSRSVVSINSGHILEFDPAPKPPSSPEPRGSRPRWKPASPTFVVYETGPLPSRQLAHTADYKVQASPCPHGSSQGHDRELMRLQKPSLSFNPLYLPHQPRSRPGTR